ncbi:hypothetical protein [Erythrobacter sp.]|jgi:zinc transporter ZupT|uniref:hypothetical protein n=1 Tax=Erythrobacter sp. TaxID=1042 RepID=UPI002EBF7668|nr:hypothetical protein [Erythrobacter sp.]
MESDALLTLGVALLFCAVHLFMGKLTFLDVQPRSRWLSFAGGVAVGYVFLHILPELAAHGEELASSTGLVPVFAESLIYALSLAGLVIFYGIERAAIVTGARRDEDGNARIFWIHIIATAALAAIIAYLLSHREDTAASGLALYTGALLIHFVTADFAARSHFPQAYDARGRWVLAVATLAGWAAGYAWRLPELAIACLFAFLGGGMVLIVLKEELPAQRESSFLPFLGGALIYSALVLGEHLAAH